MSNFHIFEKSVDYIHSCGMIMVNDALIDKTYFHKDNNFLNNQGVNALRNNACVAGGYSMRHSEFDESGRRLIVFGIIGLLFRCYCCRNVIIGVRFSCAELIKIVVIQVIFDFQQCFASAFRT